MQPAKIRRTRLWLGALALLWASLCSGQTASEPQIEAAYLVNFVKYVEWPDSSRSSNNICLFGRDTLGSFLSAYEGKSAGGKELKFRRVYSPDDMTHCQLVFIPDVEEARIPAILKWTANLPILTVSDSEGFARAGGGIELVRSGGRVQFVVNADTLSRNGLKAGSQMLRLALRVVGSDR